MPILTISSKTFKHELPKATTFFSPERLTEFKYGMTARKDLAKGNHIRVSLVLTLFDKVSKNIFTLFEDSIPTKLSICLSRSIFHNPVTVCNLHNVLAHNVMREMFERFELNIEGLEDLIKQKLKQNNYSLYLDSKRIDGSLPVLTVGMTLAVDKDEISKSSFFNSKKHSWLNCDALSHFQHQFQMDDDTLIFLKAFDSLSENSETV